MRMLALLLAASISSSLAQDPAAKAAEPRTIATADSRIVHFVVDAKESALYTLSEKNTVASWNLAKQKENWHVAGDPPPDVALSIGTKFLCVGSLIPAVRTCDVDDGKSGSPVGAGFPPVKALAYAADTRDRWVWIAMDDGVVHRLVPKDAQSFSRRSLKNGGCTALAIDPESILLAVGGVDKTIRFVGASSATVDDKKVFEGHADSISALAFAGKATLFSGAKDGGLRAWNVATGKLRFELAGHTGAIQALTSDAKGARAASGDASGKVLVWDVAKGKQLAAFQGKGAIGALAFLDKGKSLAACDGGEGLVVWPLPD
jgi:WD40 repeat protein